MFTFMEGLLSSIVNSFIPLILQQHFKNIYCTSKLSTIHIILAE